MNDIVDPKKNIESREVKQVTAITDVDEHIRSLMVDGEEVLVKGIVHWAIYWRAWAVLILALLVGVFLAWPLGLLLAVAGLIMLTLAFLTKKFLMLVLTNKRVLTRYGIMMLEVTNIRLQRVESIELERMLPGQLLDYANVVITGTGQRIIRVPFISNARAFRQAYDEMTLGEEMESVHKKDD